MCGVVPLPVGSGAAGAFEDGEERQEVPRGEDGVEHGVSAAGGDEEVAVAIAPCACDGGLVPEGEELGVWLVGGNEARVAAEECGGFSGDGLGDAYGTVQGEGLVSIAPDAFTQGGEADDPVNGLSLV